MLVLPLLARASAVEMPQMVMHSSVCRLRMVLESLYHIWPRRSSQMLERTMLESRPASPQSLLLHLCMHQGLLALTAAEKEALAVPVLPKKFWMREALVPAGRGEKL